MLRRAKILHSASVVVFLREIPAKFDDFLHPEMPLVKFFLIESEVAGIEREHLITIRIASEFQTTYDVTKRSTYFYLFLPDASPL